MTLNITMWRQYSKYHNQSRIYISSGLIFLKLIFLQRSLLREKSIYKYIMNLQILIFNKIININFKKMKIENVSWFNKQYVSHDFCVLEIFW